LSGFIAVLDACVLYPAPLRDLLLSLAAGGLYRAKWSEQIHDEWTRNLLKNRDDLTVEQLQRCCTCMNAAVPDSLVTGYEQLIDSITLNDPDDRHAVAVAIRSNADSIVTFNRKDFNENELEKFDLYTEHPDEFISNMIEIYTPRVISAVREMRARLKNPPKEVGEFLETLHSQGLPQSVAKLSEYADSL
jgi:predicted nucleic acid-binding protein